ncbi:MAG: radical SAM protein [Candidatus Aenigmarchaeota archaeon]|nr:radical SAM protein [Candidatus Aenigmarchaeota archaeon]
MGINITETSAKTILVKSNLPETDYVINCYTGCEFGCSYCYASFMGRFVGHSVSEWGQYVIAKMNAPQLLEKELQKLANRGKGKTIFISSVTDPFQGIETKYHLTEQCLHVLADFGFEGSVSILTKSPLVLNMIPLLKQLRDVNVGVTITSTGDAVSRYFENHAPPASARIETLRKLNEAGIETYAFVGPLLPHVVSKKQEIENIFHAISDAGTRRLFIEHINLAPYIRDRMLKELSDVDQECIKKFYSSESKEHREELNVLLRELVKKYHLELLHGDIIIHDKT